MKVDTNNRIHLAVVVYNFSSYSPELDGADPSRTYTVGRGNGSGPFYTYDEEEFMLNYTTGSSILYAYSDDGGETFHGANGQTLDTPISPDVLVPIAGSAPRLNGASFTNGGLALQDASNELVSSSDERVRLAILPDGNPIIHFRKNAADDVSGSIFNSLVWDGTEWVELTSTRDSGAGGGMVSDATGGLWLFESHNASAGEIPQSPVSAGSKLLYSRNGIDGPWQEIESRWENGNRVDAYTANTCNVIRYIEMNIQNPGTARVVSVIAPEYVEE